jgi:predicted DNA-binding transcriptional regulator YafY
MILCRSKNVKAKDIASEIEISLRQVYRDINCLRLANIPIYSDKNGYNIVEDFFMPKINFTISEALTLMFLINSLKHQKGTPYMKSLDMASDKILNVLPKSLRKIISGLYLYQGVDFGLQAKIDYKEIEDMFNQLYSAYMDKKSILISYYNIDRKEISERKIDPYGFKFYFSVWYLIGYCHLRKSIRTFRIDRIRKVQTADDDFQIRPDFSMEDFFSGSWGIIRGEKANIRLLFDKGISDFISEIKWHPTQRLSTDDKGDLIAEYEVMGLEEIERWILSLGSNVKVLEPPRLKERIYKTVLEMKKNYD